MAYTEDLATEAGARRAVRAALDAFGRWTSWCTTPDSRSAGWPSSDESLARLDALLGINTRAAYALAQRSLARAASAAATAGSSSPPPQLSTACSEACPIPQRSHPTSGLTRSLALAGAPHGIRVNAIEPAAATRMAENLAESEYRDLVPRHHADRVASPRW